MKTLSTESTQSAHRATDASTEDIQRCGPATFAVRTCSSTRVAVAVVGEIDASNGRALGRYVQSHTRISRQLVLDMRTVDFFGSQGFTALYFISVHCARSDVDWVIVGSPAVQRLLSVCDPEGELPSVSSLSEALTRLDRFAQYRPEIIWNGRSGWHAGPRRDADRHPA